MDSNKSDNDSLVIQEALEIVILMLAPIVPHFSHALWQHLGHSGSVIDAAWPTLDESALSQRTMLIVLQVNGKVRAKVEVAQEIAQQELETLALEHAAVKRFTDQVTVRKVIVVPGRLVNIVAN